MTLGANAKEEAICFALCFVLGIGAGIIALLFLRKARPMERALTDFVACIGITGVFLCAVEYVMDGRVRAYGAIAFTLGTAILPFTLSRIRKRVRKTKKNSE